MVTLRLYLTPSTQPPCLSSSWVNPSKKVPTTKNHLLAVSFHLNPVGLLYLLFLLGHEDVRRFLLNPDIAAEEKGVAVVEDSF
mmetsp:Transcript_15957/g.29638  ORF Transcript_15957/g.29638 Transcript_15957/m.29638 type:complete len:83 (-) Transcript_15957:664-912(-)